MARGVQSLQSALDDCLSTSLSNKKEQQSYRLLLLFISLQKSSALSQLFKMRYKTFLVSDSTLFMRSFFTHPL